MGELLGSIAVSIALFIVVMWYQGNIAAEQRRSYQRTSDRAQARLEVAERRIEDLSRELGAVTQVKGELEAELVQTRALNAALAENNQALKAQVALLSRFTGLALPGATSEAEEASSEAAEAENGDERALLAILANPVGWPELNLRPEIERLRSGAGQWTLLLHTGEVTRDTIANALDNDLGSSRLVALFYAGHGEGRNLILSSGPHIDPEWLGTFVRNYGVECVILAACHSNEFASALEGIDRLEAVITIGGTIPDPVANVIGVTILEHIGRRRSLRAAKRSLDVRLSNAEREAIKIVGNLDWRWPHRRKGDLQARG